jgi:Ricin-type beta-trefoil lectin domain.
MMFLSLLCFQGDAFAQRHHDRNRPAPPPPGTSAPGATTGMANFDLMVSPNPTQVLAGQNAMLTIMTQNQGLPPDARSVEYTILSFQTASGASLRITPAPMMSPGPAFTPIMVNLPIPSSAASGDYTVSIRGVVKKNDGTDYGSKDFPDLIKVTVQGSAPSPPKRTTSLSVTNTTAACSATADPAAFTLTNDFKGQAVVVRTSSGCTAPEIMYSFPNVDGIITDMSNCSAQKQADGSYTEAKFMVRAGPQVPQKTWEMPFIHGYGGKTTLATEATTPITLKITVGAAGGAPTPQPAGPLPVTFSAPSGILKNRASGKCLTASGPNDGAHMVIHDCQAGHAGQSFDFGPHGELHNQSKCAALFNSSTDDNTQVVLWACNNQGQDNEMWTMDTSSRLIGRTFGKCMEPNGSGDVTLRPCSAGDSQKWSVEQPVAAQEQPLPVSFPAKSGILKNRESGKCVTIDVSGGRRPGMPLIMQECRPGETNQVFEFGTNGEILNKPDCAVLDHNSTDDNTAILLWTCNGTGQHNEMWTFDSSSRLIGRTFRKCMEPNGSSASGNLILRPCWDGNNQKWSIENPPPAVVQPPSKLAVNFPAQNGILRNERMATCLTAENGGKNNGTRLVLGNCVSSAAQIFTFGPNGEIKIDNQCAVLFNNQTADDTPVVLWTCSNAGQDNEIWTMDSSRRLVGRVHQNCIEPNASDGAGAMVFRPCWTEKARLDNQQWKVEQPVAPVAPPPPQPAAFTLTVTPASVNRSGGTSLEVRADGEGFRSADLLTLTVDVIGDGVSTTFGAGAGNISYQRFKQTGNWPTFTVRAINGAQATIRITAVAPDGTPQVVNVPVNIPGTSGVAGGNRGNGRPNWKTPDPSDQPEPEPQPAADLSALPQEFQEMVRSVRAGNISVEGLGDALEAVGSDAIMDPEPAAQQIAFLKGYEALMRDVESPSFWSSVTSSDSAANDPPVKSPEFDPAILASMMDQTSLMYRNPQLNRAEYQTASLGSLPLFFEISYDTLPAIRETERQRWNASAYTRVELVIQQLRWARRFKYVANMTGILDIGLKTIDMAIDKCPWKDDAKAIPFLRAVAITNAIVTIADVMAKAGVAFSPDHVEDFYTTINGGPRAPLRVETTIKVGEKPELKVFLRTGFPGGPIISPAKVASLIAAAVFKTPKFKLWQAQRHANMPLDMIIEEKFAGIVLARFNKEFQAAVAAIGQAPQIKAWLDWGATPWTIKSSTSLIEINSNRVLYMESNSPRELFVGPEGDPREPKYFIKGLAPTPAQGPGAGYRLGIREDLAKELSQVAPGSILNRQGIVNITGDPNKPPGSDLPGTFCTMHYPNGTTEGGTYDSRGVCTPVH